MAQGAINAGRGGCALFSLVGLLISVFVVVWLASMATEGSPGRSTGQSAVTVDEPMGGTTARAETAPAAVDVDVSPSSALTDGETVKVTSNRFTAGEVVTISLCVAGVGRVVGPATCDPFSVATATVDAQAHLEARYPVRRVVAAGDLPFDCVSQARRCVLRVAAQSEPARSGTVGLVFEPVSTNPEITLPG